MSTNALLQLPATISKVATMAHRSLRVVLDSQEELTDEQRAKIMSCADRLGWFCFLPGEKPIEPEVVLSIPKLKDESEEKSPSQRLASVLWVAWDKQGVEYKKKYPFEVYYRAKIDGIITSIKEKLI